MRVLAVVAAALAGGLAVFAFAPFSFFPLALVSLAVLAALLRGAASPRQGFVLGFGWGLGLFVAGVSWLYVALHVYGDMPAPLAGFAIFLFCAYLALYPGIVGALFVLWRSGGAWTDAALFAGLWITSEWLRGWVFTGFPWLAAGYSQTPPSPVAGFLPLVGVFGVGGLLALGAGLIAFTPWRRPAPASAVLATLLAIVLAGAGLGRIAWTTPVGEPLRVALIQTNIEQGLKWRPERLSDWLQVNARLVRESPADLVVLPETTLPMLADRLPDGYLDYLAELMRAADGNLVLGVFTRDAEDRIYNAAISLGEAPSQHYAKQHLVPFGEYSPPLFGWFYRLVDIPMSDQSRGPSRQPPLVLGNQHIAVNICYEDLFGAELVRNLPLASVMLNLSNLAWYGDSWAQPQHLQVARVRALETGRPMLRSTNTGMTAVVMPDGEVAAVLPAFEQGVLRAEVRGYEGLTPYARWSDWPALVLALAAIAVAALRRRLALR